MLYPLQGLTAMAKELLFDVTICNAKPTEKIDDFMIVAGYIFSLNPMVQNGGDLITPSKASAKHFHWAFTRKPH